MNEPKTRKLLAMLLGVMLFVAGFALGALSNRYEVSGPYLYRVDKWTGRAWNVERERDAVSRGEVLRWVLIAEPKGPKPQYQEQNP